MTHRLDASQTGIDAATGVHHGGNLDAAIARFGGTRDMWIDLSTGINPDPYPVGNLSPEIWSNLPDQGALTRLIEAAREFWQVPDGVSIVPASGASAVIALLPHLSAGTRAYLSPPTYSEYEATFRRSAFSIVESAEEGDVGVYVHPNNPDGRLWQESEITGGAGGLVVVDESFCDVCPEKSHVTLTARPGVVVLKSLGKFWGLAGLRLGFAIARPETLLSVGGATLSDMLGPWAVSGPAAHIGARALCDQEWCQATRERLAHNAPKLDALVTAHGGKPIGGSDLFRLYRVDDAARWQNTLACNHIWSRIFPYSSDWIRLGLPPANGWERVRAALEAL